MKISGLPAFLSLGLIAATALAEESYAPSNVELSRYEHIWQRSPFVVETQVVEESAGLAQRFALTGVAMINRSPVVFLLDRNSLARVVVSETRPAQGIELISVDQQTDARNSSAVIKLGAEQASLRFDSDFLASTGASGGEAAAIPAAPVNGVAQDAARNPSQPPPREATPPARVIRRTLIRTRE